MKFCHATCVAAALLTLSACATADRDMTAQETAQLRSATTDHYNCLVTAVARLDDGAANPLTIMREYRVQGEDEALAYAAEAVQSWRQFRHDHAAAPMSRDLAARSWLAGPVTETALANQSLSGLAHNNAVSGKEFE